MEIKEYGQKTYSIYIKSTKEWVEVSEEVYREQASYYASVRKKAQRHGRCVCMKNEFWLCDGDCYNCEFHRAGDVLSLDFENENKDGDTSSLLDNVSDTAPLVADAVEEKLMLEQVIQRMRELDPEADLILKMLNEEKSDRTIAEKLGRTKSTFWRQMQFYRSELRKVCGY